MAFRLDPLAAWRLAGVVDRLKPDILMLHFGRDAALWAWASAFAAHRPKTIFCVSVGSGVVKKDAYHRWIYKKIDWITAISRMLYRNVLETLPIRAERLNKITWGIEGELYERRKPLYRKKALRVGTLARVAPGKGQDDLIRAWARVSTRFPKAKLILAGASSPADRGYVSNLQSLISKFKCSPSVEFIGHVDDVPDYLASLDVFVFPSRDEAYGVSLVEAMASGLPVLGGGAGGVLEIIRPGRDGLLFTPGYPASLEAGLLRLMESAALRARLGKAARSRALEKMTLERTVNLYEKLFRNLMDGSRDVCPLV